MDSIISVVEINGKQAALNGGDFMINRKDAELIIKAAQIHLNNWTTEEVNQYNKSLLQNRLKENEDRIAKIRKMKVTKKIERNSKLFTYLMINRRNGLYKIGVSKNPKFREKTLQSEEPEIEILLAIHGGYDIEKELHQEFNYYRVRGEWFRLNMEQFKKLELRMKAIANT